MPSPSGFRLPCESNRSGRSTVSSDSSSSSLLLLPPPRAVEVVDDDGGRSYLSFINPWSSSLCPCSRSPCFPPLCPSRLCRCFRFRSPLVSESLKDLSCVFLRASGECASFASRSNRTRLEERARGVLTPSSAKTKGQLSFFQRTL